MYSFTSIFYLVVLTQPILSFSNSGLTWIREGVNGLRERDPEFVQMPTSVTVNPGETVLLPCSVKYLNDRLVSWIRRKDLSILSSGSLLFTSDTRFSLMVADSDPSSWNLQLRNPTPFDQGLYECQVNTEPKMKRAVHLTVTLKLPPMDQTLKDDSNVYGGDNAAILGPGERVVRKGTTVTLTCHVKATKRMYQRPQRLVEWLFQDSPITSEVRVPGVTVDTEKVGSEISSKLTLRHVNMQDSGIYSCTSLYAKPTQVLLVVVEEDRSEAMIGEAYHSGSSKYSSKSTIIFLSFFLLYYNR